MKDEYIYLVYRAYSEEERPHSNEKDRIVFYGWTSKKKILKAFFDQRNRKKYKVRKIIPQEVYLVLGNEPDPLYLIDFIDLKSAKTGEDVVLFMTKEELKEVEIKIQRYFSDLSRLVERDDGKMHLLELYINLDDYYLDALQYLGFKPPEMDMLFDSVEYRESSDSMFEIEQLIDSAYEDAYEVPYEVVYHQGVIPGLTTLPSVNNKILYSIESFIKVMREDM